jgi:hypothetical protein
MSIEKSCSGGEWFTTGLTPGKTHREASFLHAVSTSSSSDEIKSIHYANALTFPSAGHDSSINDNASKSDSSTMGFLKNIQSSRYDLSPDAVRIYREWHSEH